MADGKVSSMAGPYKTVSLFIPCLVDQFYPQIGEAVVRVLTRLGLNVDYPQDQTCCGQPAFNSGYRKEARKLAERFIKIFEEAEVVVAPSGSCVAMVRKHYPEIFRNEKNWYERSEKLAEKVFEFSEFIVKIMGQRDLGAQFPRRVTYHDSCSVLRSIGVREEPRALIRAVKGIEFVDLKDSERCCGFGGTFSVKFGELSSILLEDKIESIKRSGAEFVISSEISCLMNIEGALRRQKSPVKAMHLAELLNQRG
jgi:L-lactate dehydrogenase complex protein LldE